ncbi:putative neprosin activation peptide [Helianthus annuus]|nr:putative neprosin activation peptide [Helianthus annuus]
MEVKLFYCFLVVLHLFTVAHFCYASKSRHPSSIEKVEALKHLNLLNKRPVKSIKVYYLSFPLVSAFVLSNVSLLFVIIYELFEQSPDGDTIDCVHIAHQLAFDHPLLKNHTIKVCFFSPHVV